VLGFLKSVAIAPAELEGAFSEGIGFDGSAIEGFARVYESDVVAKPDPATFQVLPWETDDGHHHSARMFCDITMPDGSPCWADPRHVLRRALSRASEAGFTCYVHPEIEFFLLREITTDGTEPVPADMGGYFDQSSHSIAPHFRREAIEALEAMGISVEFSHHEGAPGQQEIDLRYADALTMADNVMTFRYLVKEVAITQGVKASFMPKPFTDHPGSGMHTHVSLFEGDQNAFYDAGDPYELSDIGKAFVAGLLRHAREISAVTNQWVNSYKRLIVGGEAPTAVCWGHANRSALVRVPMYSPGKASSRRVELRSLDSACNPYLAYAVIIAAGLRGVQQGYQLPPPTEDDVWSLSESERRAAGYASLPQNLAEALSEMETSELIAEALGEGVFDYFLRNKRAEWDFYRRNVTPYELRTYLPVM
jgi:glutamine synthetase